MFYAAAKIKNDTTGHVEKAAHVSPDNFLHGLGQFLLFSFEVAAKTGWRYHTELKQRNADIAANLFARHTELLLIGK